MESTGPGTCVVCLLFRGISGQQGRLLSGKGKAGPTLTLHFLDPKAFAWRLSTKVLGAATCLLGCISDSKSCSLRRAQQGCNCTEKQKCCSNREASQEILILCLSGPFATERRQGAFSGEVRMCEQKCHLTVWVFRECLKSLYCPQCKCYMSCACGLGFGGGSKILMEKKIPCALGFDTCSPTEEKQNHRNRSQQEDTTELPVSVSLTITPSRFHALWRGQTTEPNNRTPRERLLL